MWKISQENIKIALGSIWTQKMRTTITVFIITIGIWALVGILSVVSALKNTILSDFASMGANTFVINQYDFTEQMNQSKSTYKPNPIISYSQARAFKEKFDFPFHATSISFNAASNIEVKSENKKTDPEINIIGSDENYLPNSGSQIIKGRNFTYFDIENNNYVCVLGSDFAKGLFKDQNPIDKVISIRGAKFKVIGLLKEKGSTFGQNEDLRVFIPLQIARSIFSAPFINYEVRVSLQQEGMLDQAVDQATLTLRNVRNLNPEQKNNFGIERSDELIRSLMSQVTTLNVAAWLIGMITILGSSIALMNIMLVSVTERTKEIGIRKALGAKRKIIAMQFFTETIVISQLGGVLGTLMGIGSAYLFSLIIHFDFSIPWSAIIAAFIVTIIVAVISGLYPALKASKLDPVEALRYE